MEAERFDHITKSMTRGAVARRPLLRWIGGSMLGVVISLPGGESSTAQKKHGGKKHHHHHQNRCIKVGKTCTVKKQAHCCTGQCGTQGTVVGKCCIPSGGQCDPVNCCNGNFACTNPGNGAVCS